MIEEEEVRGRKQIGSEGEVGLGEMEHKEEGQLVRVRPETRYCFPR